MAKFSITCPSPPLPSLSHTHPPSGGGGPRSLALPPDAIMIWKCARSNPDALGASLSAWEMNCCYDVKGWRPGDTRWCAGPHSHSDKVSFTSSGLLMPAKNQIVEPEGKGPRARGEIGQSVVSKVHI